MSSEEKILFTQKDGGFVDNNYSTSTGKLNFDIPLFTLKTELDTSFDLKLQYHSNTIERESSVWANEINAGLIGAGFSINVVNKISVVSTSTDTDYILYFGGSIYSLKKDFADIEQNKVIAYTTKPFSRLRVSYSVQEDCWFVRDELGILYIFGINNVENSEKGKYNIETGTYTEASPEYRSVRDLISQPGRDEIPVNHISDNTINDAKDRGVTWDKKWVGPSFNKTKQTSIVTDWNLSNIYDEAGNAIGFYYIQHLSNITPDLDAVQYTVSNYLYKIQVSNISGYKESIVLNYVEKDSFEYSIDYTLHERPNGMQQKFQKLRLDSIMYYSASERIKKIEFVTQLVTTNDLRERLVKRQLEEIRFIGGYENTTEYQPSYLFEYYSNDDGVRPGAAGFDELHDYINYETGALYGHISSITYPSGERRVYKYQENDINIASAYYEGDCQDVQFIHTNFDYSFMIKRLSDNKTSVSVLMWTLSGWKKQELLKFVGYDKDYIKSPLISLTNYMIGLIDLEGNVYVYSRSDEDGYTWSSSPFEKLGITDKTIDFNKSILEISEECIALCIKKSTKEWMLHLIYTDDKGISFRHKRPVINLYTLEYFEEDNYVSGGMVGKRFILFSFIWRQYVVQTQNIEQRYIDSYVFDYMVNTAPTHSFLEKAAPILVDMFDLGDKSAWNIYNVNIGGYVHRPGKVYLHGNIIELRYESSYQVVKYNYEETRSEIETGFSKNIFNETSVGYLCDMSNYNLTPILYTQESYESDVYENRTVQDCKLDKFEGFNSNVIFSSNGMSVSYFYSTLDASNVVKQVINFSYDGDKLTRESTDKPSQLILRDNTFLSYYYEESKNVFRKGFEYFDHKYSTWNKINIGESQEAEVKINNSGTHALEILNYIGLALFILFLPFGVGSLAGVIFTTISIALFATTTILQMVYKNTVITSLNVDCGYFGNRFINDGKTIWFRNLSQDLLTSIGSGESFQPDDSLSSNLVKGKILTDIQQFGVVYNFVPFFTDAKILYYRKLQNGAVGAPVPIHSLSRGIDDMYVKDNTLIAFKSNTRISATKNGNIFTVSKKESVDKIGFFHSIDACCRINNNIIHPEHKVLYFFDSRVSICFEQENLYSVPSEISLVIEGTSMIKLDSALEFVDKTVDNVDKFFMFSGLKYELVEVNERELTVISSDTIEKLFPGIEFNRIHCSFYTDSLYFLIYKGIYNVFKYNGTTKKFEKVKSGNSLDVFHEDMDPADVELNFTFDTLSIYDKKKKEIAIYKYIQNAIGNNLVDYTISRTELYYDPRLGDSPTSIIEYEYETGGTSYLTGLNTAVYPKINVYSCDE